MTCFIVWIVESSFYLQVFQAPHRSNTWNEKDVTEQWNFFFFWRNRKAFALLSGNSGVESWQCHSHPCPNRQGETNGITFIHQIQQHQPTVGSFTQKQVDTAQVSEEACRCFHCCLPVHVMLLSPDIFRQTFSKKQAGRETNEPDCCNVAVLAVWMSVAPSLTTKP